MASHLKWLLIASLVLVNCTQVQPQELNVKYKPFIMLEHANLNSGFIDDAEAIEKFWFETMKAGRDSRGEFILNLTNTVRNSLGTPPQNGLLWVNIGLQQFHLPYGDDFEATFEQPAMHQRLRGEIELLWPAEKISLLKRRLQEQNYELIDEVLLHGGFRFTGPSNNKFRIVPSVTSHWLGPLESIRQGIDSNGLPGDDSEGLGMSGITFAVPKNSASKICNFYTTVFGCSVSFSNIDSVCRVLIGAGQQHVSFREVNESDPKDVVGDYDGHHICLYINGVQFEDSYLYLKERGLVFNNPRFPQFTYDSLQDALFHNEFRVKDIVDLESGEVVYEIEHEIRTMSHRGFLPHISWLKDRGPTSTENDEL